MRKADNLPPPCAVVTKSGNLNFLEPSGPPGPVTGLFYLYMGGCSRYRTGRPQKVMEDFGGRRSVRPWPNKTGNVRIP